MAAQGVRAGEPELEEPARPKGGHRYGVYVEDAGRPAGGQTEARH